jgi:hypothetical protein
MSCGVRVSDVVDCVGVSAVVEGGMGDWRSGWRFWETGWEGSKKNVRGMVVCGDFGLGLGLGLGSWCAVLLCQVVCSICLRDVWNQSAAAWR